MSCGRVRGDETRPYKPFRGPWPFLTAIFLIAISRSALDNLHARHDQCALKATSGRCYVRVDPSGRKPHVGEFRPGLKLMRSLLPCGRRDSFLPLLCFLLLYGWTRELRYEQGPAQAQAPSHFRRLIVCPIRSAICSQRLSSRSLRRWSRASSAASNLKPLSFLISPATTST